MCVFMHLYVYFVDEPIVIEAYPCMKNELSVLRFTLAEA